jgi:hypothetical protein
VHDFEYLAAVGCLRATIGSSWDLSRVLRDSEVTDNAAWSSAFGEFMQSHNGQQLLAVWQEGMKYFDPTPIGTVIGSAVIDQRTASATVYTDSHAEDARDS